MGAADDLLQAQQTANAVQSAAQGNPSGFPQAPTPQTDQDTRAATAYQQIIKAQQAAAAMKQASQGNSAALTQMAPPQAPNQAVFAPSGFPQQGQQSAPSTQDAMAYAIQSGGGPGVQGPQQPQQQYPQMPGRPQPILQTLIQGLRNPQSTGAGSRSQVFEGFLGNFIGALGKGFANEGHGPGAAMRGAGAAIGAPYEQAVNQWQMGQQAQQQQAQIGQEQAQTAMTNAQREQMGQMVSVPDGRGGFMSMPLSLAKTALPAAFGAQAKVTSAGLASQFKIDPDRGVIDLRPSDGGPPRLVPGSGPRSVNITQEIANDSAAHGVPEMQQFVGQTLPMTKYATMRSGLERGAAIGTGMGMGGAGAFAFNKTTKQVYPLGQGNPGVAAAQAGAYANAKYGLVQTVDKETGAPYYESRLDAPGTAPAAGAFDIMRGRQGLDNYKRALGTIKDNLGVLDDPVQRGLIAETLKNTSESHDKGFISTTIAHMISSGLDPRAADLVAGTLSAREFISANRQFAGNVVGSEALVGRMISNIAGAGGARMLNEDLLQRDLDNTERISKGLREFQGGKSGGVGASQLPVQARTRLKEGIHTKFGNGQIWTLQNGNPVQVTQ